MLLTVERKYWGFGFMLEAVLVTKRCNVQVITEQCLNNVKVFSTPHTTPSTSRFGVHKNLGEDTDKTSSQLTKGTFHYIYHFLLWKLQGRRRKGDTYTFGVTTILFQIIVMPDETLLSCGCLNTCLPMGRS